MAGTPESIYVDKITMSDLIVYGNLSHIKCVFKDPVNQSGGIFTIANLTVLDILKQSNITPVNVGDTIPVYVMGGTIGNNTNWREDGVMLQEGEGPYPAGISCLKYDKVGRFLKDKYRISAKIYMPYQEAKQDIADLSLGKVTATQIMEREKKRENCLKDLSQNLRILPKLLQHWHRLEPIPK